MATIIKIKYNENFVQDGGNCGTSRTVSESSIAVKEIFFNINCNIGLIVDYIREVMQLESSVEFDLWDESTSEFKNISSKQRHVSGLETFHPDHTYFLIAVERDSDGGIVNYVPMIHGKLSRTLLDVIAKIKRQIKKNSSSGSGSLKINDKNGRKRSQGKLK